MEALVVARDKKLEWILGLRVWISTKVKDDTLYETLEVRSVRLDEVWRELEELEKELLAKFPEAEIKAEEFEDVFFDVKGLLLNLMRKRQTPAPVAQHSDGNLAPILTQLYQQQQTVLEGLQNNNRTMVQTLDRENVKLPKVSIELFDGVYRNWPSFEDAYTNTIHNNDNLSKTTKFKLLKRVLSDGPLSLIKNMIETDGNYEEAWEKLRSRYSKKKLILTSYITTFLDQTPITSGKATEIRALSDKSDEIVIGIRTMGVDAEYRDAWLIQILLRKLDNSTRQEWSKEMVDVEFPTFEQFQKFLNKRCDSLEDGMTESERRANRSNITEKMNKTITRSFVASSNTSNCAHCHKPGHQLPRCIRFKFLSPFTRRNIAVQLGVCLNCLKGDHENKTCSSSSNCRICQQNHHTLIHIKSPQATNQLNKPPLSQSFNKNSTSVATNNNHSENSQSVQTFKIIAESCSVKSKYKNVNSSRLAILPTALVAVRGLAGTLHFAFALLDSGSQCSFISEALVQRLGLSRSSSFLSVTGIGCANATSTRGEVTVELSSRFLSKDRVMLKAHILSSITVLNPVDASVIPNWNRISALNLADPKFNKRKDIDLLLGSDVFFDVIKPEKLRDGDTTIAQNSMFGWVVLSPPNQLLNSAASFTAVVNDKDLLSAMQKFWELEEPPELSPLSPSEKTCEEFYSAHTIRDDNGRYVTRLPFKVPTPVLGYSKKSAISRLLTMERRFEKNPELMSQYKNFMQEYYKLRHMELVPPNEVVKQDSQIYYLPHHAVSKPDSATTKLRVVFDGSCKTSTKVSLNDSLLIGPTIQDDLVTILSRFRIHPIVFSGDIEKMYRQIKINGPDTDYQRIVWRNSPSDKIDTYRLTTVTYGTACAPFLAVRTLHQIAIDNKTTHPKIANLLTRDFYIDDLLSGCDNVQEAISMVNNLAAVLSKAGMHIRKWKSNYVDVLQDVAEEDKDPSILEIDDEQMTVKTLGVKWNPKFDTFCFSINVDGLTSSPTKRQFLSQISKIFDPLGWVAPAIVPLKILFQKLWTRHVSWDEKIPGDIENSWNNFRQDLKKLEEIKIPRHFYITSEAVKIQIHGFSDASEVAYAAVVYISVTDQYGAVKSNIVVSKSKVAPVKQISLPRLELCGALLLTKLIVFVTKIIDHTNPEIYAWTDSEIVISWLSDVPRRWKTFIANRTSEILNRVPRHCWRYVPSKDNPADCASRGVSPSNLSGHNLWWNGPPWMIGPQSCWPSQKLSTSTISAPEVRESGIAVHTITTVEPVVDIEGLLLRFSKYHKVKKVFYFILRLGSYKHRKKPMSCLMAIADRTIVSLVQRLTFSDEIKALQEGKQIPRNSKLSSLTPFVDENNVLRVGGRLHYLTCPYNAKHPMIIPNNHRLTTLVIRESHQLNLHPGPSLQMSLLKQKYWIVSGRDVVRKLIKNCMTCFRQKAQITEQLMGNLPVKRLTPSRPFLTTGVDYAGPILLKSRLGRGKISTIKGYVCLFVCLTTKAVHLELVSDMTSAAFIAALRRFCGRRGVPAELVSDNGTNFKGAANELHELYLLFKSTIERHLIFDFFAENQIVFSFNPASAPHFGGIWEANVKSMKHHVRRATVNTKLTFEEMATLLCQIEGLLNSRPLYAMTSDPDDLSTLTPGHFLIGEALTTIPEPPLDDVPEGRLSRWQNIQKRLQGFWRQWSISYLHTLQQRPKWKKISPNLRVGDLVLVHDNNLPPSKWMMGRITMIHPGKDELVRVVSLKTLAGILKRPVVKLAKLPILTDEEDDTQPGPHL